MEIKINFKEMAGDVGRCLTIGYAIWRNFEYLFGFGVVEDNT